MRQSQQKNRMRGRGRKMPNPMSRNFESNGPDVKIRGNAAHIAEKYTSLARDAFSSGDTVMGENYLQHAEHYNRIVAAAQAQAQQFRSDEQTPAGFGGSAAGRGPQPETGGYGDDEDGEAFQGGDVEQGSDDNGATPVGETQQISSGQPQPQRHAGNGQHGGHGEQGSRHHRNRRRPRYGENGRDDGYRDRGARDFEPAQGRVNGAQNREVSATGGESRPGVSSDASMLPQSILGGTPSDSTPSDGGSED
jgi:hypothetical protein